MILAILQARTSSTRLPGKVLKPILGIPMLMRQVERIKKSKLIDKFVVATSTDPADNPIEQLCKDNGINCFRGSLDDVLDRFYQAAKLYNPIHIVRLTGDCPLQDPEIIDRVIEHHLHGNYDYTSSAVEPTFPDGLDAEIFRFSCLEDAWNEAQLPSQREHVSTFIYQQPKRYKIGSVKNNRDLSYLRLTVDEPEDLEIVTIIYEALYHSNSSFTTEDILDFLDKNPELPKINSRYPRNEGYKISLLKDKEFLKGGSNV